MNDLVQSDLNNQIINLTPIEIVLGIDQEGRTTARKLYEFLELAKSQFSRWAKTNILENVFAIENEDYKRFDINVEGNITTDYKLSASFAKKLAIGTHNQKGEAAKDYFIKVEEKLKEIAMQSQIPKQLSPMDQLKLQYQVLGEHDQKIEGVIERVGVIEDRMTIETGAQKVLCDLVNSKVITTLGGKNTPAYKELGKKAFKACWKDYKDKLEVASYKDTPIKNFELGKQTIINWQPNRELELMIRGCNAQMRM